MNPVPLETLSTPELFLLIFLCLCILFSAQIGRTIASVLVVAVGFLWKGFLHLTGYGISLPPDSLENPLLPSIEKKLKGRESLKIFVGGIHFPLSGNTIDTIEQGLSASVEVWKYGHIPFCSCSIYHMNRQARREGIFIPEEHWEEYLKKWLLCCDAILILPGDTLNDDTQAEKQGLKVFRDIRDVPVLDTSRLKTEVLTVKAEVNHYPITWEMFKGGQEVPCPNCYGLGTFTIPGCPDCGRLRHTPPEKPPGG